MPDPSRYIVEAERVTLLYPIYRRHVASVKQAILERVLFRQNRPDSFFRALKNVSFGLERGEVLGVCGSNGSGKSSLLRVLGGIQVPSHGEVRVRGRIGTILTLAGGFHDDLSGRDNIGLSCLLSGMSAAEARDRAPDIIDFAELGDFIDNPMRAYSSGMRARLGFSIAAHVNSEVLLVDEVLSVGDAQFQAKCADWTEKKLASGASMLLVSHDPALLRRMCRRVMWFDHGRVRDIGPADEVLDRYDESMGVTDGA